MTRRAPTNVTTTSSIEGWEIDAYLGPVAVHRVAGTGLFSDIFADFSDVFGGRSGAYRQQLESLYAESIDELTRLAELRGGNWVVGFHADFDEISGKNKQMFMLVAMGTAVRARRVAVTAPVEAPRAKMGVTGLEVSAVMREQRLLGDLSTASPITAEDWDFLAERGKTEAIAEAVKLVGNGQQVSDDVQAVPIRQAAERYLRALPLEPLSTELYRLLETEPSSALRTLAVIRDLRLGRLDLAAQMLRQDDAHARWAGLQTLKAQPISYEAGDIELLEELKARLPHSLLLRPTASRKKLFGEKQEWECVCGSWAAPEATCGSCFRDQFGIGPNDLKPSAADSLLSARIAALRSIFSS